MTLIKQYVQAMLNQDSVALSKLFSPTAIFVDYCPKDAGQPHDRVSWALPACR